ncbi:competence type IV pilus assembly protein ComGB, partial [Streptococcus pyogenes]
TIMQDQESALFQEIGGDLADGLANGQEFCQQILNYPFFRRELSLIIEYGQVKSKLGAELSLYADECWEEFFSKINRAMQLI